MSEAAGETRLRARKKAMKMRRCEMATMGVTSRCQISWLRVAGLEQAMRCDAMRCDGQAAAVVGCEKGES